MISSKHARTSKLKFQQKACAKYKSNHLHCLPYKVFRKIIFSNSNVSLFQLIIFSLLHTVHDGAIVSCSIVKYICPIALLRVLTCSVLPAIVLVVVVLTFHKTTKQNHSKPPLERIVWKQQQTSSRWRKSSITFGRLKERAMERKKYTYQRVAIFALPQNAFNTPRVPCTASASFASFGWQ